MVDIESDGISDEILEKAQGDIKELLGNRKIPKAERVQLEVQSYFLMFLINDHKKIGQMYPFFRSEKERRDRTRAWWDRFQWVIIPMIVVAVVGFMAEFIYFWIILVPEIK